MLIHNRPSMIYRNQMRCCYSISSCSVRKSALSSRALISAIAASHTTVQPKRPIITWSKNAYSGEKTRAITHAKTRAKTHAQFFSASNCDCTPKRRYWLLSQFGAKKKLIRKIDVDEKLNLH